MSRHELRGRVLRDGAFVAGTLTWKDGIVESFVPDARASEAELPFVAPGLIDLHVHGFGGFDPLEDLAGMAGALARAGTTAFQPTLFPAEPRVLGLACANLAQAARAHHIAFSARAWNDASTSSTVPRDVSVARARVLGAHLEGPFVNPLAAGALPRADLCEPSPAALRALLDAAGDEHGIATVTLAPELAHADELITELTRLGVRVSLGHSVASAHDARRAARAGALGVTHLFNAMSPLHHREAGLALFALTDDALHAEIIGDLVHVGPEAFELALRARGVRGLCLVSDALRGAGTGCDVFHSHGRAHLLRDGAAFYPPLEAGGAPRLAGSALSQLEMVRRLTARGVVSLADALTMASASPARALGVDARLGTLDVGHSADLIVLRGAELTLEAVWVAGERCT